MYKVMIIDDESIIVDGLVDSIPWESLNCSVVQTARDGVEGLELIKLYKPDIVMTDIRMPNKDGLSMIKEFRDASPNTHVIVMSGFRKFEYAQEALNLGVDKFIVKPATLDEIIEAIQFVIQQIEEQSGVKVESNDDIYQTTDKYNHLVDKVITFMKNNYFEKLTLASVSEKFFVSTWHLCRVLKRETGRSFVDILNQIRINKAKELLRNTNWKVYEIARRVGYRELTYFSNMFKKTTGYTPNEFRNMKPGTEEQRVK